MEHTMQMIGNIGELSMAVAVYKHRKPWTVALALAPAPPKHAPALGSTQARGAFDERYLPEQRVSDNIVDHILVRHLTPYPTMRAVRQKMGSCKISRKRKRIK